MDRAASGSSTSGSAFFAIPVERESLDTYAARLGLEDRSTALLALARAVASSPGWDGRGQVAVVVRADPEPVLGVFGAFDSAGEAWLEVQAATLAQASRQIHYISFSEAVRVCERLADKLVAQVGRDRLARFKFAALPRGGLVVLALLAHLLGLEPAALAAPSGPEEPLVIVDDCALSGAKFARYLQSCPGHHLLFVQLYSHPDLRTAIVRRESRVSACLAACDLEDLGPRLLGAGYPGWRRRQEERLGGDRYWLGYLEFICFAWSEPDRPIWDLRHHAFRLGWNLLPPELCLEHRAVTGRRPGPSVQSQPTGKGPVVAAADVVFGDLGGRTLIGRIESRTAFELSEVAGSMWRALLQHEQHDEALDALSREYSVDRVTLTRDFSEFVEDLKGRGLLVQRDSLSTGV